MKKYYLLQLFFFTGFLLSAQPEIDTVRAGTKSVKIMVCGYGKYGDSSGLMMRSASEYNVKGQMTRSIRLVETAMDVGYDPREEPLAESFFYMERSYNNVRDYDTVNYEYNANFAMVKSTGHYDKKAIKTVYVYDANGKCISEIFSKDGVQEYRKEWKYNAHGDLLSAWIKSPGQAAKKSTEQKYDEQNRLIMRVVYSDSTVYIYSAAGKQELGYNNGRFTRRKEYDKNDSLISSARFSPDKKKDGSYSLKLTDSTYISRNEQGVRISIYKMTQFFSKIRVETIRCDEKGRCIELIVNDNGDNIRKITYTYDDSKHSTTYRRYGIYYNKSQPDQYGKEYIMEETITVYNSKNQVLEQRKTDGKGKLVERIVYQYTYY